jgi:hypothetical protein
MRRAYHHGFVPVLNDAGVMEFDLVGRHMYEDGFTARESA